MSEALIPVAVACPCGELLATAPAWSVCQCSRCQWILRLPPNARGQGIAIVWPPVTSGLADRGAL